MRAESRARRAAARRGASRRKSFARRGNRAPGRLKRSAYRKKAVFVNFAKSSTGPRAAGEANIIVMIKYKPFGRP